MSVDLEPSELGFKRPFSHEVSQVLRLHNPHSDAVAFKVKTTAPKQYCVRPNSGRIDPNGSVEVQVLLQAMKEDPPADARCRDKFLVQSVGIPAAQSDSHNVSQIWSSIEQTSKSSIQEKKIRVTFLPADGSAPTNGVVGGASSYHEDDHTSPPAYSSPSPAAVTPQRQAQGPVSTLDEKPAGARSLGDAKESASNPASNNTSIFGSAAAAVSNVVPTSQDELRSQLAEAKAQIARLQESATEGLRQRNVIGGGEKSAGSSSSGGLATQTQPAGGVPVQIVAGLCLLCFLLAYFFF